MNETQNGDTGIPTLPEICEGLQNAAEKTQAFNRFLTTEAAIAQTPKELVWALNKAKAVSLYSGCSEARSTPHSVAACLCDHESTARARPAAWP